MAMTMKTEGLEEVSKMLAELGKQAPEVAAKALYSGAGIMADAFAKGAKSIKTEHFNGKREKRLPSPEEKAAVVGRTGIARFKQTGVETDTIVGVTEAGGYAMIGGQKKAVRLIARAINSGTSFMDKQPVFRKAKTMGEKTARQEIIRTAEAMYDEIINGSGN